MESPRQIGAGVVDPARVPPASRSQIYAEPLTAAIDRLARQRFGRPWPAEGAEAGGEKPRLDVTYGPRPIESLAAEDFPCIALGRNGAGAILNGRQGERILLRGPEAITAVSVADLAEGFSGVVFQIREVERAAPAVEEEAPPGHGIVRGILSDIFRRRKAMLLQLGLATALGNLFVLALPMFSMSVYDRVIPHLAWETLWALSIGVGIVLLVDAALRVVRMTILDAAMLSISVPLQERLYASVIGARFGADRMTTGRFANAMRDVESLCHCLPSLLVALAVDLPWFFAVTVLVYAIGGAVALAPLIGFLLMCGIHALSLFRKSHSLVASAFFARLTNQANETLAALETLKVTGAEPQMKRRWALTADEAGFVGHHLRMEHGAHMQASLVVTQAILVVAMVIGVYEIGNGAITIGALAASTLMVGRMMAPISQLLALAHRVFELRQSVGLVDQLLAAPQEKAGDGGMGGRGPEKGRIDLRGVSFTYPGETTPCLSGINLSIAPGERVGIIGRIGSGKSTLLSLLVRLYDAGQGSISLDGADIRQFEPAAIRRAFGLMRQDATLIDDTLRANLTLGLATVDPARLEKAAALSGVAEFAARHPSGLDLRVGPGGCRLSGGERQSVALARLLAGDPKVLLLDEPTAAMDASLEQMVLRSLAEFSRGRTLVIATHRAPLLALVDRVILMDRGRVVADGPKAEVLARIRAAA